jgi:trk system potassium uptake protein TrkA
VLGPGVLRADIVVAATSEDEDNLVIALLANKELAVPRIVGRVNDPRRGWLDGLTCG